MELRAPSPLLAIATLWSLSPPDAPTSSLHSPLYDTETIRCMRHRVRSRVVLVSLAYLHAFVARGELGC